MVTEVKAGDEGKYKSGVEDSHKVLDSYHDGPAPANAVQIEKERQKLRDRVCGILLDSRHCSG